MASSSSDEEPKQEVKKQHKNPVAISDVFARVLNARTRTSKKKQRLENDTLADAGDAPKASAVSPRSPKLKNRKVLNAVKKRKAKPDSQEAEDEDEDKDEETVQNGETTQLRSKKLKKKLAGHNGITGRKMNSVDRSRLHTAWENMAREKPTVLGKSQERRLQKIATRGVVALFNAVSKQQRTLERELSKPANVTERKREKVLSALDDRAFKSQLEGEVQRVSENIADQESNDVTPGLDRPEKEKRKSGAACRVTAFKRPRRAELNSDDLVSLFQ